ncbi:hypothetical protein KC331_g10731 [Hortaea werneckii]|uniref:Uncharacterized protein n=1 Tax=Hortaea werneckii TaxID=91943 RepID=A0A3M7CG02_HORWE|nr:hypothetical protein KC331_g10731 [Hortaea werneckii]KAI7701477.1 hypothetical protein KC353_g15301 [Hortaea werneckii]RMY50597.1 hypothetical protein D0865_06814 [Hortaea werneckii]
MLSTQQSKRPTLQPLQQQHPNPLFQQQTRLSTTHPSKATPSLDGSPKSQIEAMPPSKTQPPSSNRPQQAMPLYNPAIVHPVFFSNGWHKPPFPLPFNAGWSPAAAGYAFNNRQRSTNNTTKL